MPKVIEIKVPIDEIAARRERVEKAKHFKTPDRVPAIPAINYRFLIPRVGVRFKDYYADAEVMLRTQIMGQKWLMENIKTDAYDTGALTRDPDGGERCVACYLCAVVCPVACISLQAAEDDQGRRYPEFFRINYSRCIFCGYCEEACPTYAIQLTPDFEMSEYKRQNLVYEKEDLLISGQGKQHGYNFYRVAGLEIKNKAKGEAENEAPPVDVRSLLP